MALHFDHVVHFVKDPATIPKELQEYGLLGVEGGSHMNLGTYNTLCYFGLSYIEFLGAYDEGMVRSGDHLPYSLHESVIQQQFAEGFIRFALRTDSILEEAAAFRKAGLTVNGPISMSRKRKDGSLLEWQLLFLGNGSGLDLPFIIQWNEKDAVRERDLNDSGLLQHPSEADFSHLSIAAVNGEQTAKAWAGYFGGKVGRSYHDEKLQSDCHPLTFEGGNLVFCTPYGEKGVVAELLKKHGEKPFEITLITNMESQSVLLYGGSYTFKKRD